MKNFFTTAFLVSGILLFMFGTLDYAQIQCQHVSYTSHQIWQENFNRLSWDVIKIVVGLLLMWAALNIKVNPNPPEN